MTRLIFALCTALVLPSARGDEAAARAIAERIVDLVGGAELIERNHAATLERAEREMISRGMPPEGAAELRKAMSDWFSSNFKLQEIRSNAAAIYTEEFTEEELRQMLAFYEAPVGQKALRKMAMLGQKVTAMAEKYTAAKNDTLKATLRPILLKYGMTNMPNPLQRMGASRSAHETNRTSSAAGSRR